MRPGDLIVYDRGYYARDLLQHHHNRGLHAVFTAATTPDCFDKIITLRPHQHQAPPLVVRLLRAPKWPEWVLVTTLLDRKTYPAKALGNRYHQRWSIEELYKQIKPTLTIENFHATAAAAGNRKSMPA
ncbi:MAG: transposase [Aestuariivita sp.]|nr:transposase [Aestuariivita sp.]MCY4348052.1 transposase [Aestuariivita sp.]